MRHEWLEDALTALASKVVNTERAPVDIEFGEVPTPEGKEYAEVRRIQCPTYALTAWEDELSEADICAKLYQHIVRLLPKKAFTLYWRVKPEYTRDKDFCTNKWRHRVLLRIGWYTEDFEEHS